jgi:hypothetical protein
MAFLVLALAGCGRGEASRSTNAASQSPISSRSQQSVVADIERLLMVHTKESVAEADAEMIQQLGPVKIKSEPALSALMERVLAADKDVNAATDDDAYAERVEDVWLPQLKSVPTKPPETIPEVWDVVSKFEQVAQGLKDGAKVQSQTAVAARKRLKAALVARQVAVYPALREGFAKATYGLMWQHNVEVRSQGPGSRQIVWVGGLFASNANVQSAEDAVEANLIRLHFARSAYRWIPDADGWNYKLASPEDKSVGIWNGGQFEKID